MKQTSAFTLLEVLVTAAIFAIIAAACWALLDGGRQASTRGQREAARHQAARTALRTIEGDLRAAFTGSTVYDSGFRGTDGGTPEAPLDSVDFVAIAHQPAPGTTEPQQDFARIVYRIDADPATELAGLVREKRTRVLETVTAVDPDEAGEEIAADVVGLNLRYYADGGWSEAWDSSVSGRLPAAVEIAVHVRGEWRDQERIETFTTKVYLPVAATAPPKTP